MNVKDIVTVKLIDPHTNATRRAVGYVDEVKPDLVFVVGLYLDHETPWGPPKYPPLSHRWEVSPQQCCVLAPGHELADILREDVRERAEQFAREVREQQKVDREQHDGPTKKKVKKKKV